MREHSVPDSLSAFIDRKNPSEWSAQLINPTRTEPMNKMVEDIFGSLDIELRETDMADFEDDLLLVLQDGEVVSSSPLDTLRKTLLMVNSDLYKTGARPLDEIEIPDIIEDLKDTVFTLRGHPHSDSEKLVLTLVSRYIEQQAVRSQTGTLRTSFQYLSRLNDEQGTREVYEQLDELADLDTHVYGFPDWTPPPEFGPTVHEVRDEELRQIWFVVYRTGTTRDWTMLAIKTEPNTWQGYWTTNAGEIQAIEQYISQTF